MKLSEFNVNDLDLNEVGNWPWLIKGIVLAIVFVLVVFGAWKFGWQDQLSRLESAQKKENDLKQTFETKQRRAANLDAYEAQLKEMQASFGAMLRQLPSKVEVAGLLVDISQTGLASGLEFDLFKPGSPIRKEFYAELPIQIQVRGTYNDFGRFISGVANLPRIVTLHDISIQPAKSGKGGGKTEGDKLVMSATAKTYWYLEEGGGK